MSIEQQILSLERLAVADVEITELTAGIEKERGEIAHLRDELSSLNERLEVDRVSISEMDKTRGDLIQELRQIAGQIDRSRDRLQRARNEREMNAAERELDELRKIQRDRDDEIKKLAELSEQAKVGFRESEERRAELDARLSGSLEGTTQIIAELESKLEAAQSARKEVTSGLPSLVFRRYERLHSTGKAPIASTHDGTCLGCFVKLPPMMFHKMLSRLAFEECPTCHRIIYYTPPPSEEELAARAAAAEAEQNAATESDATEPAEQSSEQPAG